MEMKLAALKLGSQKFGVGGVELACTGRAELAHTKVVSPLLN